MIQIDMPMPKNCGVCPVCNEYLMCGVPCNGRGWGENDVSDYFTNGRPEWCPLKEQEGTINELQNAYGYLQKQFFEAQDKLLKEQEAIKPIPPEDEFGLYRCGKCYHQLFRCVDKYCSRCGQEAKWE